jgi:hypothetical protein
MVPSASTSAAASGGDGGGGGGGGVTGFWGGGRGASSIVGGVDPLLHLADVARILTHCPELLRGCVAQVARLTAAAGDRQQEAAAIAALEVLRAVVEQLQRAEGAPPHAAFSELAEGGEKQSVFVELRCFAKGFRPHPCETVFGRGWSHRLMSAMLQLGCTVS